MTSSSGVENSPESDPVSIAAEPASTYDRAPVDEDVLCPLCYYNLRGAVENRCPECGYRFQWRDLRDPARRRHPYLFEHHPRRNVWSLRRTFIGTLRPRRFWRELRPEQPSNVRRLVVYWFAVNLFALALPLAIVGMDMARHATVTQQSRAWESRGWARRGIGPPGGLKAWLDARFPLPPSWAFFKQYFSDMDDDLAVAAFMLAAIYAAWPWITFLGLNVFQISMLRARVRSSHVLRCVVYTFDAMAVLCWGMLFLAAGLIAASEYVAPGYGRWVDDELIALALFGWAAISLAVFAYRLTVAYKLYLQFHQPFLVVLTSQILAGLFMFTVVLWIAMWDWHF